MIFHLYMIHFRLPVFKGRKFLPHFRDPIRVDMNRDQIFPLISAGDRNTHRVNRNALKDAVIPSTLSVVWFG